MTSENKWTTVITPKKRWFDLNLKELKNYKDLIFLLVKRTFVAQYKQTVLGPLWAIIQPLLTTVVFTVVFAGIANISTDTVPAFVFYMCGNVAWAYFSGTLTATSGTFTANTGILSKVYFPRLVMPISSAISNLISFGIQLVMFLCFWLYYLLTSDVVHPNAYLCLMPILVIEMAALALGCGVIISALTTKYRDLTHLVSFGVSLWMYGTPIAYTMNIVPEKWVFLFRLNPMTPIMEILRYGFFGSGECPLNYWFISLGTTFMILFLGVLLFSRIEKNFVDTV